MPKITPGSRVTDMAPRAAEGRRTGFLSRVAQGARYAIRGVQPDTWMSPGQPVAPVAQTSAWGRKVDFPVGYNLIYTPRQDLTPFWQLRALAKYDLVALAIETRKDQLVGLKWAIAPRDDSKSKDARSDALETLFRTPDGRATWQAWLRQLMHEVLVTDAPAIIPRKRNDGSLYGFELIDGATIKVLADDQGRVPVPPSPAYQQVIKGMPAVDYTADELVYMPRNPRVESFYGFSPVEQVLMTVNIGLRRQFSQLQYFTEGSVPEALATVPQDWSPEQVEAFQAYWDSTIEGDQSQKRKIRWVPGGTKADTIKEAPLKDEFDEWLARVVTYAFSLPPTQFSKQEVRATTDQLQEAALKEGLEPMKVWIKDLIDYLLIRYLDAPDLEFRWDEEEALDPQSQQAILTAYQAQGNLTINEVRAKLGYDPVAHGDTMLLYTKGGVTTLEQAIKPPEPVPATLPPTNADTARAPGEPANDGHDHDAEKLAKADNEPLTPVMRKVADAIEAAFALMRENVRKGAVRKAQGADGHPVEEAAAWDGFASAFDTTPLALAYDDLTGTLSAVAANGARAQILQIIDDGDLTQDEALEAVQSPVRDLTSGQVADALQTGKPVARVGTDLLSYRDPDAIAWAEQHAAKLISSDGSGGELADATRNMLRRTLTKALADKASNKEIADLLERDYAFSRARAELIARTEVRNATGHGRLEGAKRVGMLFKDWLLSNDDSPCPLCVGNAAQGYIPIQEPFSSGVMAPLAHPRCRCTATYTRHPHKH